MSWKDKIRDKIVSEVSVDKPRSLITISFKDSNDSDVDSYGSSGGNSDYDSYDDNDSDVKLYIHAQPECCDSNWFEFSEPISKLVGKKIKDINETSISLSDEDQALPRAGNREYKLNFQVTIIYTENDITKNYNFIRCNESNGYYSGYLNIYCK